MNTDEMRIFRLVKWKKFFEKIPIFRMEILKGFVIVGFEDRGIPPRPVGCKSQFMVAHQTGQTVFPGDANGAVALRPPIDQVAQEKHGVITARGKSIEKILEFGGTAMDVADYDQVFGHEGQL